MFVSWNVFEFKVEEEDSSNPLIDGSIGLYIGVAEHTFDVTGVDFNNKLMDTNEVEAGSTEGAKKTVELKFDLGIMGLALIP